MNNHSLSIVKPFTKKCKQFLLVMLIPLQCEFLILVDYCVQNTADVQCNAKIYSQVCTARAAITVKKLLGSTDFPLQKLVPMPSFTATICTAKDYLAVLSLQSKGHLSSAR